MAILHLGALTFYIFNSGFCLTLSALFPASLRCSLCHLPGAVLSILTLVTPLIFMTTYGRNLEERALRCTEAGCHTVRGFTFRPFVARGSWEACLHIRVQDSGNAERRSDKSVDVAAQACLFRKEQEPMTSSEMQTQ